MNIYVASSWKNPSQPAVVLALMQLGHDVYDFRNPDGATGFSWRQLGVSSVTTSPPEAWREMLKHPVAQAGYLSDRNAIDRCEALVCILPCGKSASWKLGYAHGKGKRTYVYAPFFVEPELMFLESTIFVNMSELLGAFAELLGARLPRRASKP